MKERTAWLVTCVAGTSVVLAFYAVFSSHLGGEIVSIVASRKRTQSVPATFGQNWQAGRGVILNAVSTGEKAGRRSSWAARRAWAGRIPRSEGRSRATGTARRPRTARIKG